MHGDTSMLSVKGGRNFAIGKERGNWRYRIFFGLTQVEEESHNVMSAVMF